MMKIGWFELNKYKYKHDDCYCSETWAIHIYSYEDEDDSTPDVTLLLNTTKENGNGGYYLMEYSITSVGRVIMFDEANALVKKLDEISSKNDSVTLTEHLMVCREFFNCRKITQESLAN
ncbi:hypothetical protein [Paenibacillus psychroresistens]|nr:hypothetical protein [Paenibacillus psychroresistens]